MTYIPTYRVEIDDAGNFIGITRCTCDDGDPTWPGHSEECPLSD